MLNERPYRTADEARAHLNGLTEFYDKAVAAVGVRQTKVAPDQFVAAFVDGGREDYSEEMRQLFTQEELEGERITGEEVVARYFEKFPNTENYGSDS